MLGFSIKSACQLSSLPRFRGLPSEQEVALESTESKLLIFHREKLRTSSRAMTSGYQAIVIIGPYPE